MVRADKLVAAALVAVVIVSGLASIMLLGNKAHAPADTTYTEDRTARLWVDLASVSAGSVKAEDRWGSVETFSEAKLGTNSYYRNVSFFKTPSSDGVDVVVLDGYVWAMIRKDSQSRDPQNVTFLRYSPEVKGQSWNISFEVYAPQGTDWFDPSWGLQQIGLTATLINTSGSGLARVNMSYGTPGSSWVRVEDVAGGASHELSDRLLPSTVYRTAAEGQGPQRYILSFSHVQGGGCNVSVYHTSGVLVGTVAVDIPAGWGSPFQLVLSTRSQVLYNESWVTSSQAERPGAWALDNFACRGASARYPMAGPLYEYAGSGSTVPTTNDSYAFEQPGARVSIDGAEATYNATTRRYEADVPLMVRWGRMVNYSVELDGVMMNDSMSATMYSVTPHAGVAAWWNGWDWVSVFGEDDCSGPGTALDTYSSYEHPVTAYIQNAGGSSSEILASQSEIALHYPHNWATTGLMPWGEAVQMANDGMAFLHDNYEFASRWDDPANGGSGDTYISMANPGNRATYQLMYALYGAGIRVDGRSSDGSGAPGNHSQVGSWYWPSESDGGWYPYLPIDLMDANRGMSFDYVQSWSSLQQRVDAVAENHGVLRVYGHPGSSIRIPEFLHWIDDPKTNYSLENWKATDGEVASYLYGRWSTNVRFNEGVSSFNSWTFNISHADPKAAGYWNVPVTVAVDLNGRAVKDVVVQDGGNTYRLSDGSLKDLHGARIMDQGVDVRDGVLYVSQCWDPSATLTVIFKDGASGSAPMISGAAVEMAVRDP